MTRPNVPYAVRIVASCCLIVLFGCSPPPGSSSSTPVERYLETGKQRERQHDYDGALAAYERALAMDINNADVHYQLGLYFESQSNAPEKSLYHFIRALEIDPDHRWAQVIEDRIFYQRRRVSAGLLPMVPCPELEQQIEELHQNLSDKNAELQRITDQARELARELGRRNLGSTTPPDLSDRTRSRTNLVEDGRAETEVDVPADPPPDDSAGNGTDGGIDYTPPSVIPYRVQPGDTLYSLSRRFSVSVQEIMGANADLNQPTDLKAGHVIRIPQP